MHQHVYHTEDNLERMSQDAVRSTLAISCDDLRFYDYICWQHVIDSLNTGEQPLLEASTELKTLLKSCDKEKLKLLCSGSVASFTISPKNSLRQCSIPQSLMRSYVLQHKFTATHKGSEYATQVYGISHSESTTLTRISGFLDNIRTEQYTLTLRCSEKTVISLLKLSGEEEVTQAKMRKIQESLSHESSIQPDCTELEMAGQYDTSIEGRANEDLAKKLAARKMLVQGFSANTVSVELGLSARQCRTVAAQARSANYLEHVNSTSTKSSKSVTGILRTNDTCANASILMRAYASLGGPGAQESTQIRHIVTAYTLYCAIRHDVYGLAERSHKSRFTIQDAWILAVDYRSRRSYLTTCRSCASQILRSTIQKQVGCECPFCD